MQKRNLTFIPVTILIMLLLTPGPSLRDTHAASGSEVEAPEITNGAVGSSSFETGNKMSGGQAGYALDFDGTNDFVRLPDFNLHNLTIEAWFKPTNLQGVRSIIYRENDIQLGTGGAWSGTPGNKLVFTLELGAGRWIAVESQQTPTASTWYHVAVTYDHASMKMYINGQLEASRRASGNIFRDGCTRFWVIGGDQAACSNNTRWYWAGVLDEIRVWNFAREQEDIQSTMRTTLSGDEAGLVAYWRFDEGSGQTASDSSGNGRHGGLGSSSGPDSSDPTWVLSGTSIGPQPDLTISAIEVTQGIQCLNNPNCFGESPLGYADGAVSPLARAMVASTWQEQADTAERHRSPTLRTSSIIPAASGEVLYLAEGRIDDVGTHLFRVNLDSATGRADLVLMPSGLIPFYNAGALACTPDGTRLYAIDKYYGTTTDPGTGKLGYYDVRTASWHETGVVKLNSSTIPVPGIVLAAFSSDRTLYAASEYTDSLYSIDTATAVATLVGRVVNQATGATVNVSGADIAFAADGTLYLWANRSRTRAPRGLYALALPSSTPGTVFATHLGSGSTGSYLTGLAIRGNGLGDLVASTQEDEILLLDKRNASTLAAFRMYKDGSQYNYAVGDMTVGPSVPFMDLTIPAIEITQGIQCLDNPNCFGDQQLYNEYCGEANPNCDNAVPLVEGRPTWVRVYPDCGVGCQSVAGVTARLLARRQGDSDFTLIDEHDPITVIHEPDLNRLRSRDNYEHTFNFLLPPAWRVGTVEFRAEVNPPDDQGHRPVEESQTDNNLHTLPLLTFSLVHIPSIAVVRTRYLDDIPYDFEAARQQGALQSLYPIQTAAFGPWPEMRWDESCPPTDNARNKARYLVWKWRLLNKLKKHVGLSSGDRLPPDKVFALLPTGACERHGNSESIPGYAAFGSNELDDPWNMAHEIGHLYGRRHTMKSGELGYDSQTDWPYGDSLVQTYGFDILASFGTILDPSRRVIAPDQAADLMSYTAPKWMSPFTYAKLFEGLRLSSSSRRDLGTLPQPSEQIIISGLVYTDTVELDPLYRVTWPVTLKNPPEGGNHCLELWNANGELADRYCFNLPFFDVVTGEPSEVNGFVVTRPYVDDLERLILRHNGTLLGELGASSTAPSVTITSPNDGEAWAGTQTITWTAGDADGDPLTYSVFYSPDGGQSWAPVAVDVTETTYEVDTNQIAGSINALIRILATDGLNTASDTSDAPFTVATKPPQLLILTPESGASATPGTLVLFLGQAYDLEDGPLSDSALMWTSDRDGTLGAGAELALSTLSPGQHTITLTATGSDGNQNTATIGLYIGHRAYLPLIGR